MLNVTRELIDSCIKKDRRSQNKLFELCYGILMSISLRYEKNEEDARYMLNIGFLKIITNLNKFTDEMTFEYWIRRIMINTLIDEFRKNKRRSEVINYTSIETNQATLNQSNWNQADVNFQAEELEILIRKLPAEAQKVFNMFAIDGYSHKEIAKKLSIPVGTSKWLVSTARKTLAESIAAKSIHSKVRTL